MKFLHADPEFPQLLLIVAEARGLPPAFVEKDYWVTHTLWALHEAEWEIWFKGGTSLSKGFGLIHRFSEDLDLRLDSVMLPPVSSWTGDRTKATRERQAYFLRLSESVAVADCQVERDLNRIDERWRSVDLMVIYPGHHLAALGVLSPFVRLELGNARVTPFVVCPLGSFIHAWLIERGQFDGFIDNRPKGVRCVHPMVTLIEKIDAIQRRFEREPLEPAGFVRHYEDAARIIQEAANLPPLEGYGTIADLAAEMHQLKQIRALPHSGSVAFEHGSNLRWSAVNDSYQSIQSMYWGPRISLSEACTSVRLWIDSVFGTERPSSTGNQPSPPHA